MRLKIFDLRCFIALCKRKNFTRAAEEMYISQPPFSRIIQKLEFDMGGMLVDRKQKSFSLTPLGEKLLEAAEKTVQAYDESMRSIELIKNPSSNDLKIGYTYLASQLSGFYEILNEFSQQTSDISLEETHSQELFEKLRNGILDVGLIHFPIPTRLFEVQKINKCEAAVLFPKQICCFREKRSYDVILEENKVDKTYNDYLLKNFPAYDLSPVYKGETQLSPQIALQGQGGVLIYPEPVARSVNRDSVFTLEILEEYNEIFGLYVVTPKNPIKTSVEKAIRRILSNKK